MLAKKFFITVSLLISAFCIHGQELSLKFECHDQGNRDLKKLFNKKSSFNDSLSLNQYLFEVKLELIENSFLACSFDSIRTNGNQVTAYLTLGRSYNWVTLGMGNVDEEILSKTGYRDKFFTGSKFSYKQLSKLFERIISLYENTGFPFAVIELDSVKVDNDKIRASLKLSRNKLVKIDSVKIYSKSKISANYIHNYIGISPGDLYQEKYVKKIDNRLNELAFITESRDHDVAFTASNTILNLYLEKANANRFDGIVGVLPNEDDGKVEFTGDVKLRLLNSFNRGELINFNWRRLVNKSQDLKFKFNYPYLLNTPFGVDFDFKLYRRDTTFIDIYLKYGLQYMWKANNYVEIFIHDKNSNLLSTAQYENSTVLPPFADINSTLYGIGINIERLNYRLNPRKGYSLAIQAEVGTKNIRKISDLNPEIYDGLQLKSNLYNLSTNLKYFIPISRIMTIMVGNQSAYTFNENIFENELFRIGGLLVLRGFDEESIFTSAYAVNTLEYRILLEKNSYWYLFMDAAYYENTNVAAETFISDTPYGFGTGISFQTNAGIFSINYALGKQFDNPIVFRAAKIHFGFVNYF